MRVDRRLLRPGLILLTAAAVVVGAWALFAPESFYDDFPGGGRAWVSVLPPYNEHLVRDVGALNVAVAVMVGGAAYYMDRRLIDVALVAYLVYAVPHFFFHMFHLEDLSTGDQVLQMLSLGFAVALPLYLLALNRGR
jgi:hypothetical protein